MRALPLILGLLSGAAWSAAEWDIVTSAVNGSEWRMRRDSLVLAGDNLSAAFVREANGTITAYRASTLASQCGKPAGDLQLTDPDGKPVTAIVWRTNDVTVGRSLAAALCQALKRTKR
jgi:hypothetical protein